MIKSTMDRVLEAINEVLQDVFEIEMIRRYGNNWQQRVQTAARNQYRANGNQTYRDILNIFNGRNVQDVKVSDFDTTPLHSLMCFDFVNIFEISQRRTNNNLNVTIADIKRIKKSRNNFQHLSNYKNDAHILNLEIVALDNIENFLKNLQMDGWNYPVVYRKYLGTGNNDGILNEIRRQIRIENKDEAEYKQAVIKYSMDLQGVRDNHKSSYVPLSYNLEANPNEKKSLDTLMDDCLVNQKTGFRLVAEGGYGKTWSIFEIAGNYATKYLADPDNQNSMIPIVVEFGKLYSGCSTINKKVAALFFKGDESKISDFYRENKVLLLLDALDEANVHIQNDVAREMAALVEMYPNITFVCSSRKSCIDKYPTHLPCFAIKLLDDDQIIAFMEKAVPQSLLQKVKNDWVGENKMAFLYRNRTPFYVNCYIEFILSKDENDHEEIHDTTKFIDKFFNAILTRELQKNGFNSDKATFINFLKELRNLLEDNGAAALPESDVLVVLNSKIIRNDGEASLKSVCNKLIEMQILSRDEEYFISYSHQKYYEYMNRKYPRISFRPW